MIKVASKAKRKLKKESRKRLIFYIVGMSVFVVQFLVYYVWANIGSITLAFQKLEVVDGNSVYIFNGLNNFKEVLSDFANPDKKYVITGIFRGILIFILQSPILLISSFFAYYIARKLPCGKFFQIMLFAPGIISGIIFVSMYKYFVCDCVPAIYRLITGKTIPSLLDTGNTNITFIVILIYSLLMSFGSGVFYIASAMSEISDSIKDAAQIDGVTPFKEFIYIYFPLSWEIISINWILSLSGFLLADIGLFTFYSTAAPTEIYTLGYYMTLITVSSTPATYPYIAALGLMISAISIPVTLISRKVANKISERWN